MAQVDARPEQIIRSYLESQEGPVEAHILHIKETFEIDDLSADNLARVATALEQASIGVDPPLSSVPADGMLMLTLRNGHSAVLGTNGSDPVARSRFAKQPRFPRRRRRAKPAKPVKVKQPAKLSEEAVAARELLKKALMEGTGGDRVREAMSALEGAAANPEDTLVAITDLLPKFGAEAERRLKESEQALKAARASREQVAERLTGLDTGLGKLVEREGTRAKDLDATGKSTQALSKESEEKVAAARRGLLEEIAAQPWRADLKQRFDELGAASSKLLEARKQEVAQTSAREQQSSAASAKVVGAREAVEAALSDPNARGQLEQRVSTLREAEKAEVQAEAALKEARTHLAGAIDTASNGLNAARERLGQALATEHDEQLRARLELLGKSQSESIQALQQQLGALTEKLNGDAEAPQQLRTTAAEALRIVRTGGEGDASGPANVEAAIASNRSALEALRPIDELLQVRAQIAAGVLERLSSSERRVAELEEQAKTDNADLAERADALERGRQAAAVADKRRAELESELGQRHKELQAAREEAQKAFARFGEAEVDAKDLRDRLSKAGKSAKSAKAPAAQPRKDDGQDQRIAELQAALEQRTTELEQAQKAATGDASVELKRQLAAQEAELERVRRQERVARKQAERLSRQLGASGGAGGAEPSQRRRSQEGQLMEAVDSVKRALLVSMEPPAGTPAPEQRPDDQRQQ